MFAFIETFFFIKGAAKYGYKNVFITRFKYRFAMFKHTKPAFKNDNGD